MERTDTPPFSAHRRLWPVAAPFVVSVVLLVLLALSCMDVMNAVRAYVEGESLWSKAQKEAVRHLERYALTGQAEDFAAFRREIATPLGDRLARIELERVEPDYALARRGLLEGGNHAHDVPGMMRLFRYFRHFRFMDRAIGVWTEADGEIAALERVGNDLHALYAAARAVGPGVAPPAAELAGRSARIAGINARLTPLEREFSATLGDAARRARLVLELGTVAIALSLIGIVLVVVQRLLREGERYERALRLSEETAQVTLQSIGDAVLSVDGDGRVAYLNPVAASLLERSAESVVGRPIGECYRLIDEHTRAPLPELALRIRDGDGTARLQVSGGVLLQAGEGREIAVKESAAPIHDRGGVMRGIVVVLHDMRHEREYASQLSHQASHDALTGLINRREFESRLMHALNAAREQHRRHALLYLDLDQFKIVNDTCGHAAGDELLRQVSAVLLGRLRERDTLARLGGDEFGALLEDCPPDAAERVAEELRRSVAEHPFGWGSRSFALGVSIGLVTIDDGHLGQEELLAAADSACYVAKDKGRNRVQRYHARDSDLSARQGEMDWVGRIHQALDAGRFCLYAQPIVAIAPDPDPGDRYELLVRMLDDSRALVPPLAFIPAAERYHLMPAIDRWVVDSAFERLEALAQTGEDAALRLCCINLSGASIGDERFLEWLRARIARAGPVRSRVCFEITETAAIANLAHAAQLMRELRELGCSFALDDFGAGMSSFGYLKQLPVDYLKIDGSFVRDMLHDPIDAAMVSAINDIGHLMHKRTIAESVENDAILARLREVGVDYAQGYGVARPWPYHPR